MFFKIQCLVSTVLMACCYLTLENYETLEQTETCHLDIQVHCHLKYIWFVCVVYGLYVWFMVCMCGLRFVCVV